MLEILSVVFVLALAVQLIYFIVLSVAAARYRAGSNDGFPGVSVVVCAHDEEHNLTELIPLLLAQDYPLYEVIVVNDRSNDGTFDLLLSETGRDSRLKMVQVERLPPHANAKKYGLTLGIKAARHDWILLTDADCRPAGTSWIQTMSMNFDESARIVIGFSPYIRRSGLLNLFVRFDTWITAFQYFGFALLRNPYMGVGRNMAYRKSFFLEKKGFNRFLGVTGGDDDLFVNEHGTADNVRLEMRPESLVYSLPKESWGAFIRQKVRHLNAGKHYRTVDRVVLGIFSVTWILTWGAALPLLAGIWNPWWVVSALGARWLLVGGSVHALARRWKVSFEWWAIPLLDFLYTIYYISSGVAALTTKKVQWTK